MEGLRSYLTDHADLLAQLGLVSIVSFVLALVVFPLIVIYLPEDYFERERREVAHRARRHPFFWMLVTVVKNLIGVAFIVAGIAMLVLPGQGLLSILLGVSMTNFPGKFSLERRIVRRPAVRGSLNRIRRWANRPELEIPDD